MTTVRHNIVTALWSINAHFNIPISQDRPNTNALSNTKHKHRRCFEKREKAKNCTVGFRNEQQIER